MDVLSRRTALLAIAAGALLVTVANVVAATMPPLDLPFWVVLHSVLEGVSVIVAALVFAIGASADAGPRLSATRFIAYAFLAVALFDSLHLLTYGGMPDAWVANTWHRNLFFWLAARLVSAMALLMLAVRTQWPPWRTVYGLLLTAVVLVLVAGVTWMAGWRDYLVPLLFTESTGPSDLKVGLEYAVMACNLLAIAAVVRRGTRLDPIDSNMLIVALAYMAMSELCFTIFSSAGDLNNVLGHVMKTAAFVVLYRAVFVSSVRAPYRALQASERALGASRALVESAFDESASPKAIEAVDGEYVRVNAAFARFMGRAPEWFDGRRWSDVVHPDDLATSIVARADVVGGRQHAMHVEKRFLHADGGVRWGSLSRVAISAALDGVPLLLVEVQDITQRKQTENELARSAEALRQSQKTEAVGRLAGGIAHDFNNLLTAIISSAALLKEEVADNPAAMDDVAEVDAAARRGAALTRQLLAFSRQQGWTPEPVDLVAVVGEFAPVLRRLGGTGRTLDIHPAAGPLIVYGDRSQLEQVILNLVINASDAVGEAGTITVAMHHAVVTTPQPGLAPGAWGVLAVSDDGCGMSTEVQAHIFDPFFTTKPIGQGTGLGLSTVYGIVAQHGGVILLDSAPNRGTTFRVHFPLAAAD